MIMFMHMEHNHEFRLGRPNIEKAVWHARLSHVEYRDIVCFLFIALTPRVYTEFFHPKGERFISMILNHNK